MNIETEKEYRIFRNENNGKVYYNIGLSHKKQDDTWEYGTMSCRFPKDADIPHKAKIKIHSAWLDFWLKDKVSHPYVFINKYEILEEDSTNQIGKETTQIEVPQNTKSEYDNLNSSVQINDDDLPF